MTENVLQKAIENAVKAEELGISFYADLAKKFDKDPELNRMFKLLARDEVEHKRQFEEILKSVDTSAAGSTEHDLSFLESIDISQFFQGMDKVDTSLTPQQVLKDAFNFEKETVLYYSGIRDVIGASPQLDEIIRIEKQHVMQLLKVITTEGKFRGISDTWY